MRAFLGTESRAEASWSLPVTRLRKSLAERRTWGHSLAQNAPIRRDLHATNTDVCSSDLEEVPARTRNRKNCACANIAFFRDMRAEMSSSDLEGVPAHTRTRKHCVCAHDARKCVFACVRRCARVLERLSVSMDVFDTERRK